MKFNNTNNNIKSKGNYVKYRNILQCFRVTRAHYNILLKKINETHMLMHALL